MRKSRAGNENRTRDIQLGKLGSFVQKLNILAVCAGKNQAKAGPKRPLPARDVWEGVWEDDPMSALRRWGCP